MEWYWWVLIAVGLVAVGVIKVRILNAWMQRRKAHTEPVEEEE